MAFQPVKQLSAIIARENFEPTLSWSFRVMLALNVPLIFLSMDRGFSGEVIWASFSAYMLSLIDYRGLHYKKIFIQASMAIMLFVTGILGMVVAHSIWLSVTCMFAVGMFAAFIRNWRDYGSTIGVGVGFFYLFGLAYPLSFDSALHTGFYMLAGSAWAIFITLLSFGFKAGNPVKRSVAKIWSANTALLDTMQTGDNHEIIKKEIEVRSLIDLSIDLFERNHAPSKKGQHYNVLMELRRNAALFSATLGAIHEAIVVLDNGSLLKKTDASLLKTLSSFAQASARMAIVIFTSRTEDLLVTDVRIKRCEVALQVLKDRLKKPAFSGQEPSAVIHLITSFEQALFYLISGKNLLDEKLGYSHNEHIESYRISMHNFSVGLRLEYIADFFRALTDVRSDQVKYALRVSVTLCVGVFAFLYFKIGHGYWIPLTLMIVIQPYYGATRKKGFERIIGTVAGIVLGGVVMLLPFPKEAFLALLVVVSFLVAYYLRNNYKIGVFFVTVMMVILMQLSQQVTWQLIGWRLISTLIGALLAFTASYFFWPVWERHRFPELMREALTKTGHYLQRVLLYYNNGLPPGESWFAARRLAEGANNNVFASVQRMEEEPEHARNKAGECFAMVGMNIRITREITSIALLAQQIKTTPSVQAISTYRSFANIIFEKLAGSILSHPVAMEKDITELKKALADPYFANNDTLLLKSELEKIVFELEALHKMEESLLEKE